MKKSSILVLSGLSTLAGVASSASAACRAQKALGDEDSKGRVYEETEEDTLVVELTDAQREYILALTGKEAKELNVEVSDQEVLGSCMN